MILSHSGGRNLQGLCGETQDDGPVSLSKSGHTRQPSSSIVLAVGALRFGVRYGFASARPIDTSQEAAALMSDVDRRLKTAIGGRCAADLADHRAEWDQRVDDSSTARLGYLADTAFIAMFPRERLRSERPIKLCYLQVDVRAAPVGR
jgi:hypothetical protein